MTENRRADAATALLTDVAPPDFDPRRCPDCVVADTSDMRNRNTASVTAICQRHFEMLVLNARKARP